MPTISTLSRQMQGLGGQVHGLRNDVDLLLERQKAVADDLALLRGRLVDAPMLASAGIVLSPEPRPSMAVQATQKAASFGKYTLIVLGALGVAAQVAAVFKPGLVGPIQTVIELLGGHP